MPTDAQIIYPFLVALALARQVRPYKAVADLLQVTPINVRIRMALQEIDAAETRLGHPLLCAVIIRQDTGVPGDGFFRNALELGRDFADQDHEWFWDEELQAVFDFWEIHHRIVLG